MKMTNERQAGAKGGIMVVGISIKEKKKKTA